MDFFKYKNPMECPKQPTRPVSPKVTASAQEHRVYADELDQWEKKMVKYRSDKQLWKNYEVARYEAFKIDALEEVGLTGNPTADRAYSYAYQRGRDMSDIMIFLNEAADLILGDNPIPQPPVPNPMRELVLARIEDFKKEHNNFPVYSMRWQDVIFRSLALDNNAIETHISNLKFETLNDADLLEIFEKIIRRHNVQM